MFNLFKRKKPAEEVELHRQRLPLEPEVSPEFSVSATKISDPEDPGVHWIELPDGLRLKFRNGRYVGWYNPLLTKEG